MSTVTGTSPGYVVSQAAPGVGRWSWHAWGSRGSLRGSESSKEAATQAASVALPSVR